MSMSEMDWPPMGSVATMAGRRQPVAVAGRLQREEGSDAVWDYVGFPYPNGASGAPSVAFFNGSDVQHVLFIGYRNEAELQYCSALDEAKDGLEHEEASG